MSDAAATLRVSLQFPWSIFEEEVLLDSLRLDRAKHDDGWAQSRIGMP